MKRYVFPILPLILVFLLSCSSGRKALERGDYDRSVLLSVNRLRSNPDNDKARSTLSQAYPMAKKWHLENIRNLKNSTDQYRWEKVANEYSQLNLLAQELRRCPACLEIVKNPQVFTDELAEAKLKAAEMRYALGDKAMQTKTRQSAREAYYHFLAAENLVPGFRDVKQRIDEAKFHATLKVVVQKIPVHSQILKISDDFFESKIYEFLAQMPVNEFVRFYEPDEAEKAGLNQPDQLIRLSFDDFVVGQTFVKERIEQALRDSVPVKIKDRDGNETIGYTTARAEVHIFQKTVTSSGLLDFQIVDYSTGKMLAADKLPGTFVWTNEWGFFNGDERALNEVQRRAIGGRDLPPPPPQQLFVEFTKPIYDQLTARIRDFYAGY